MKAGNYSTADVKRTCEDKLEIIFKSSRSDHFNGWYNYKGKKTARITVSKGRKPIPRGTYSSMAKQLKLTISQFDDLLECPLTKNRYDEILKELIETQSEKGK